MGCHTWFSIPVIETKQEIIELATINLQKQFEKGWITESSKKMYDFAIEQELITPVCELACADVDLNNRFTTKDETWTLYKDPTDVSLQEYNKKNNTNYTHSYLCPADVLEQLETYSDEPRIGGYPNTQIKSYQEMLDFMKTGYTSEEDGKHYDFYYDKERYNDFMSGIKSFFEKHPKGLITFG